MMKPSPITGLHEPDQKEFTMGLFKGMKDMKDMLHATPGLLDQANQMQVNAQAMQQQAAQQQAMQQQAMAGYGAVAAPPAPAGVTAATPTATTADVGEPIAGVDLATFAQISAGLAAYDYDQSKAVVLAGHRGIAPADWEAAVDGWNARIAANPAVARQFNALYTGCV